MVFSASVRLPPEPWAVTVCRSVVEGLAGLAGLARPVVDDLIIAVTEAGGNAIRHAAAGGPFRMEISLDDRRCVIRICDRGPGFAPDKAVTPPGDTDVSGRGLLMIRAVMDDVRIEPGHPGTRLTMTKTVRPRAGTGSAPDVR